jgi:hypothetical protein
VSAPRENPITLIGPEKKEGFTLVRFDPPHGGPIFRIMQETEESAVFLKEAQLRTLLMVFCCERMGITI